jgi:hypothetical protein
MRTAVVVSFVVLAAGIGAGPAAGAPKVQFGIQDDAWLEFGPGRLSDRVARLDRLGLDLVRVTLNWQRIEPARGELRWARSDRLLRALRARGLAPVVTVWGTPSWANDGAGQNVAPARGDDVFRFAQALAERYPFVRYWTFWNEPNKVAWLRPASPETYVARILNPGYRGIKSVLPQARVAGGVTAPRGGAGGVSPVDFLRRMARAGARLDAYAHHPYPVYPGDTPDRGGCACKTLTMSTLERLVRLVQAHFPRARIWLTEYGYQTNPPDAFAGVSYAEQARFVAESARRVHAAPRVDMLIHYLYRDEPDVGRWQSGLETIDGRMKPARAAMMLPVAQVSRRGTRTTVWGHVRPGSGRQSYVLQRLDGGRWTTVGGLQLTNAGGYLQRTVVAARGSRLRIWHPGTRAAGQTLVVR